MRTKITLIYRNFDFPIHGLNGHFETRENKIGSICKKKEKSHLFRTHVCDASHSRKLKQRLENSVEISIGDNFQRIKSWTYGVHKVIESTFGNEKIEFKTVI